MKSHLYGCMYAGSVYYIHLCVLEVREGRRLNAAGCARVVHATATECVRVPEHEV